MNAAIALKRNFWTTAFAVALALWGSSAPSLEYPLYAAQWRLETVVTTAIFAIYPAVLIVMLLIFGNASDYLGRRTAIIAGLSFLLAGTLTFALAPGVAVLFVARILQGIGVGLVIGSASAALVDYNPYRRSAVGPINSASQAVGNTAGFAVGAVLIQFAPEPLRAPYWVLAVAFLMALVLAIFLPSRNPLAIEAPGHWRPQGLSVPQGAGRPWVVASVALSVAFGTGAVFLSLGADIAQSVLPGTTPLIVGAILGASTILVSVGAVLAGRIGLAKSLAAGATVAILSLVALLLAATTTSLAAFAISSALAGPAIGLLIAAGIGTASAAAPAQHRAKMISGVFVMGYVVQAGIALSGGAIATASSLAMAAIWTSAIMIAFSIATILLSFFGGSKKVQPHPRMLHCRQIDAFGLAPIKAVSDSRPLHRGDLRAPHLNSRSTTYRPRGRSEVQGAKSRRSRVRTVREGSVTSSRADAQSSYVLRSLLSS